MEGEFCESADSQQSLTGTAEELLPLVYEELRRLAASRMALQPHGQTLQATALVHEAWLRLGDRKFESRAHFFSDAAQAMRHLLVERARRKLCERHGGGMERVDSDEVDIEAPTDDDRLLQIHEVLDDLAAISPEKAQVVKLRCFVGLEAAEIAEVIGVSLRTVERHWAHSKAWLFTRIRKSQALTILEKALKPGDSGLSDLLDMLSKIYTGLGDTESAKTATDRAAAAWAAAPKTAPPPSQPEK
jgi:RNA polymerase sigma factor (TIGR02999 family)